MINTDCDNYNFTQKMNIFSFIFRKNIDIINKPIENSNRINKYKRKKVKLPFSNLILKNKKINFKHIRLTIRILEWMFCMILKNKMMSNPSKVQKVALPIQKFLYFDCLKTSVFFIDCRYDYDYEGGHIKESININDPEIISTLLFKQYVQDGQDFFTFLRKFKNQKIDAQKAKEILKKFSHSKIYTSHKNDNTKAFTFRENAKNINDIDSVANPLVSPRYQDVKFNFSANNNFDHNVLEEFSKFKTSHQTENNVHNFYKDSFINDTQQKGVFFKKEHTDDHRNSSFAFSQNLKDRSKSSRSIFDQIDLAPRNNQFDFEPGRIPSFSNH